MNLREALQKKEVMLTRIQQKTTNRYITISTPSGTAYVHDTRPGEDAAVVYSPGGKGVNPVATPYTFSMKVQPTIYVLIGHPQTWWLYPPYEPENPDYPYLLWMTTNPPKLFPPVPENATPISTPQQLQNMGSSGYYYLTNDIDMSGFPWRPIRYFTGILDGRGYTIRNLSAANSQTESDLGIFEFLDGGEVRNLRLENVTFTNRAWGTRKFIAAGFIAAAAANAKIDNIFASGRVLDEGKEIDAAGVFGACWGNISLRYVYVDAMMNVHGDAYGLCLWVGGGTFEAYRCWLNGTFFSEEFAMGALLLANNDDTISVDECAMMANLTGTARYSITAPFWAICGHIKIKNSFARGRVQGESVAGFLVWMGTGAGKIENCYAATSLSFADRAQGFLDDYGEPGISARGCYFDGSLHAISDSYASPSMRKGFRPVRWDFAKVWGVK